MTLRFNVIIDVVQDRRARDALKPGSPATPSGSSVTSSRRPACIWPTHDEGRTTIRYVTDVGLTGKLGGLGQPVFRATSARLAREFGDNLKKALEAEPCGAARMKSFELLEPATLDEAVALLDPDDPGVRAIAGATALMLMMKARLFQPARLISLRRLDGALRGVRDDGRGGLRIGAMTTLAELEHSTRVRAGGAGDEPRAAHAVERAHPQRGDARRSPRPRRPAHGPAADPDDARRARARGEPPRRALDRHERLRRRLLPDGDCHGRADCRSRDSRRSRAGVCTWYAKFAALSADDWPTVGVAVWFRVESDRIAEARVAVSAATERPVRVARAEAALTGAPP